MAVITQFIVVRDGVEKMTFATKKEADAYDKQLDIAENLAAFIEDAGIELGDKLSEELTLHLAKEAAQVASILKGSKPKKPAKAAEKQGEEADLDEPAKVKLVS